MLRHSRIAPQTLERHKARRVGLAADLLGSAFVTRALIADRVESRPAAAAPPKRPLARQPTGLAAPLPTHLEGLGADDFTSASDRRRFGSPDPSMRGTRRTGCFGFAPGKRSQRPGRRR